MSDQTPSQQTSAVTTEPPAPPAAHPSIAYNSETRTLTLSLPFDTHSTKFYLTEDFATWHTSFISALPHYAPSDDEKTDIIVYLNFPYHHTHTISNQRAQRSLLKELVKVLNGAWFEEEKTMKLDVVMKAVKGSIEWAQVKVLAPFWGLRGGYGNGRWRLFLKEGESKARVVKSGDEWEVKLRNEYRDLFERREL